GIFDLALGHHEAGRLAEAERLYRLVLAAQPDHAVAHGQLGLALKGQGRLEEAAASYGLALGLQPVAAAILYNLGNVLRALGRPEDAIACYVRAIVVEPGVAEAHYNLGVALKSLDRLEAAAASYGWAVVLRPHYVKAHLNLASTLVALNRRDKAIPHYERAIVLGLDDVKTYGVLATTLEHLKRPLDAERVYRHAIARWPQAASLRSAFASLLYKQGRQQESEAHVKQAILLKPQDALSYASLGALYMNWGWIAESLASCERALTLDPNLESAQINRLLALTYVPVDLDTHFAEHRRYEERFARPLYHHIRPHANPPEPDRRLRIGYLSYDFRFHAVGRNVLPLLAAHNRKAVEIFCYSTFGSTDSVTRRFQTAADVWRPVADLDDAAVAERIRADGIDILVCLAGRFQGNRPRVAAYKPAPIQVSLHDIATSGLEVMDYLLADRVMCPRHGPERFTERVLRLPSFYLAAPLLRAPKPWPPPVLALGEVSFGCFNNPAKLSPEVLVLWAKLLARMPNSRLVLKYTNRYEDAVVRDSVLASFARHGIDTRRIVMLSSLDSTVSHLNLYNRVDIALDPFPFCGSTTTYEALWMGVPVVTLPGDTMVSRWSASMLTTLGLTECIARDADEYIAVAERLAADPQRLAGWRAELRARVMASPLCNGPLKARHIERAYRAMWRRWCARQRRPDDGNPSSGFGIKTCSGEL
ncbi:MAG TPA: tetratricopeptide repeat protein, partial [Azospirillaceae bacterium]|nr:tetratricopeptide repeat protein [Azospirillaceae bacterium]